MLIDLLYFELYYLLFTPCQFLPSHRISCASGSGRRDGMNRYNDFIFSYNIFIYFFLLILYLYIYMYYIYFMCIYYIFKYIYIFVFVYLFVADKSFEGDGRLKKINNYSQHIFAHEF